MIATVDQIHHALETVVMLRQQRAGQPALAAANAAIKRFQAQRFQATTVACETKLNALLTSNRAI